MDSIRKLAVLVSALDCDVADLLIQQFEGETASELRQNILGLQSVSEREEMAAIQSFLDQAAASSRSTETADEDLNFEHSVDTVKNGNELADAAKEKTIRDFLEEASVEVLGRLLNNEQPQTIANVLSNMSAANASQVVSNLSIDTQADVLQRLYVIRRFVLVYLKSWK